MCCVVGGECYALRQLSRLKSQSVVSGYAKKVYVAVRAGHIRRCKTRIYGKGQKCTKAYIKRYTGNVASKAVFLNDGLVYNVS